MMIDSGYPYTELLITACLGVLLGSLYFGGLWLTVRRATRWRYAGLAMMASLLIRLALVGAGLYVLADGQWQRYVAALPGLMLARWWWVRRMAPQKVER